MALKIFSHNKYISHENGKRMLKAQSFPVSIPRREVFYFQSSVHNFSINIDDAAPPPLQMPAKPFSPGLRL